MDLFFPYCKMNVAEFFGNASAVVAKNDGTALVIGRITMLVLGVVAIIALLMLIIWLANQCIGARPQNFEHFEGDRNNWYNTKFVPYLQAKLTNLTNLKKSLDDISNNIENVQDSLGNAQENICTVTEDIRDNYINARMSGIDPTLATEPQDKQDRRLASRKERSEKAWKRRAAAFTAKQGLPLVECYINTGSSDSLIIQIRTTCDDIQDTVININELAQTPEFQDVLTQVRSIEGSIQFTTPFLVDNATVMGNNVALIRDMPNPGAVTEGFEDNPDPETYYNTYHSDVAKREKEAIAIANNMISGAAQFLAAIKDLIARSKNALDVNTKIKATTNDLKDGKITPAYMDDKP